jgi:hypothetical protein
MVYQCPTFTGSNSQSASSEQVYPSYGGGNNSTSLTDPSYPIYSESYTNLESVEDTGQVVNNIVRYEPPQGESASDFYFYPQVDALYAPSGSNLFLSDFYGSQ